MGAGSSRLRFVVCDGPGRVDLLTRKWWRAVGREVDLAGEQSWLGGPRASGAVVRDGWIAAEAARIGGSVAANRSDAGLVADMSALDGPGFNAADLAPAVRDFYQHTSSYRLELWTGWRPIFWIGGELVARYFGRRVEQLALPMRPLDVAQGMDSTITVITVPTAVSARRPGCGPCARPVITSTAAATRRATGQAPTERASTLPSLLRRATSRSSCARTSTATGRCGCVRPARASVPMAPTPWYTTAAAPSLHARPFARSSTCGSTTNECSAPTTNCLCGLPPLSAFTIDSTAPG